MKSKVAILIAVAVIASIFVAGCTSNTSSSSNQTTSQSAVTNQSSTSGNHDKVLQAVINDDQQAYVNSTLTQRVPSPTIKWINETTAIAAFAVDLRSNSSLQYSAKYLKFNDATQARDYVSSINQGYNSTNAVALINDPALITASSLNAHQNYKNVTGLDPVTNSYSKVTDQGSSYNGSYIIQVNEVVITFSTTVMKSAPSGQAS
ncbi:MAG: hypothetical protein ACXV5G_11955 [Halobacteriota archaeon]